MCSPYMVNYKNIELLFGEVSLPRQCRLPQILKSTIAEVAKA